MTEYPETLRGDVVDELHGRDVPDPYRWLEDPDSADTADWVHRQNAVTESYLGQLPDRDWFRSTLRSVVEQPRAGVPSRHGGHYFVTRNDGTRAQDVLYVAASLEELLAGGRVLVDPNTFSADGTSSLGGFTVSDDGHYLAYTLSEGGSDWHSFVLLDVATGQQVDDAVIQTKFSEPVWLPDSSSYLYTDFAHEGHAAGTQTDAVAGGRLRRHRVGRPQADDELVLELPGQEHLMIDAEVSADARLVLVSIVAGTENRNRLWVYRIGEGDGSPLSEPVKLVDDPRAELRFVRAVGSSLLLQTDLDAPRGRLVRCDLDTAVAGGLPAFSEVIAEGEATLDAVVAVGDQLVAVELSDAQPRVTRYGLDGTRLGSLEVAGGALVALNGDPGDPEGFLGFSSVTSPTTAYRFDAATGAVTGLGGLVAGGGSGDAPVGVGVEATVVRRRATSADGTAVPYFLVSPLGLDLSVPHPTLLYGYGGFKIPLSADYSEGWAGWLAAGGVVAIANLRGGGEYGTDWYDDGRLERKQHVFDDFIAVAEDLQATGVTTAGQLALHGRSNGGLLVGAVMTQRPDLAAVALPGVGVLDLLRFHRFTIGAAWVSDYGSPEDPDQFADLLAYSPLHNVRPGTRYPATLITTGDHDDRVVPLHSHKFLATLQHAQAGDAPVLSRIEVATGHGAGKPRAMVADEWADLLAFAAHHTGLHPGSA